MTNGNENGAASVLAVGVVAACVSATLVAIPIYTGLVTRQNVSNAADSAALAAADVAIGIVPGVPCELAGRAAELNGARLAYCSLDGVIADVTAEASVLGVTVRVRARAGPPPSSPDHPRYAGPD